MLSGLGETPCACEPLLWPPKWPAAVLSDAIDISAWAATAPSDPPLTVSATAAAFDQGAMGPADLIVTAVTLDVTTPTRPLVVVAVSGGLARRSYLVTVTATSAAGRTGVWVIRIDCIGVCC